MTRSPYSFILFIGIFILISSPISAFGQSQPTSLTFVPAQGYAGADCYEMTVGNGAGMLVDFDYTIDNQVQPVWMNQMDPAGKWQYCLPADAYAGTYMFTRIKNHQRTDWVVLNPI